MFTARKFLFYQEILRFLIFAQQPMVWVLMGWTPHWILMLMVRMSASRCFSNPCDIIISVLWNSNERDFPYWYAGISVNIDYHFDIDDQSLQLDTPNQNITSHYYYSTKYGFNPCIIPPMVCYLKSRRTVMTTPSNSYKGIYASLGFREWKKFGGSQNSTMLYIEWRNYTAKTKPGMVLAFGHGVNLSPVEMFPTWLCHPSDGILMVVQAEDMYRVAFAAPTWSTESRNSECRFQEMVCLVPLHFWMQQPPAILSPARLYSTLWRRDMVSACVLKWIWKTEPISA